LDSFDFNHYFDLHPSDCPGALFSFDDLYRGFSFDDPSMPSSIVAPSSNAVHCDSADALVTNVPSSGDPFPAIDFSTYGPADVSSDNASSLANASSGYLDPRVL